MCSERLRLEEQIKLIESQLKQLPTGKLICKRNETRYKWYNNKDGKQIYIPKKERKLAEKLAARKYLEHLYEDLLHEKKAIEFYIRHHKEGNADKMLTQMPEYQELLKPYFKVLSEELYEWQNSPYNHSLKYPEQLKQIREIAPHTYFLIPGYGAQGGKAEDIALGFDENGILFTFIPKYPDIIVGIDKISVTTVRSCITLFWLLFTIALKASMILLSISP